MALRVPVWMNSTCVCIVTVFSTTYPTDCSSAEAFISNNLNRSLVQLIQTTCMFNLPLAKLDFEGIIDFFYYDILLNV